MLTMRPRGTNDILPEESKRWHALENIIHAICAEYGYQEIRTPIFEHTELFARGVGETTDIVEKEMYSFLDRSQRSITLRPEGTAPTVRAFLEHKMYAQAQPTKMYYIGPMFRYGRPQAGRFRQFHQFGVEAFGSNDPAIDGEIISLGMEFYRRIGLKDTTLLLNSVGCPQCRAYHREQLHGFLAPKKGELCSTCQGRYERNPLRIFDCKSDNCREIIHGAPTVADTLCHDCKEHFEQVQKYLTAIDVPFKLDPLLVRGLDYYTHTAFEIVVDAIGAQNAIGGGGRYNGLVEAVGGPSVPGIGFGLGLERILLALEDQGSQLGKDPISQIYIAISGEEAKLTAFKLANELRKTGLKTEMDYLDRSLRAQLKYAGRHEYPYVIIIGEEELAQGKIVLREMDTGQQQNLPLTGIIDYFQKNKMDSLG